LTVFLWSETKDSRAVRKAAARAAQPAASIKSQFLNVWDREHKTTVKALRAYPHDKLDVKPHAKSKSARDLAFVFANEGGLIEMVLTSGIDFSKPMPSGPKAPETLDAIIAAYEASHRRIGDLVRSMSDKQLTETTKFPVAPRTIGDVPKIDFLWMMLMDQIHHRGQLTVYLRLADARVPSIYGPTADEPWM